MTCKVAAGQQKKRLSSSKFHERYRGMKKKKLDSSEYTLNSRSHIDLEWDANLKRAVAKREQVGISWRDMSSFVESTSPPQSGVADVISVPHEIFSLANLTEVLSYEVWATCLSEAERKLLTQFLPSGASAEQVVHSLLKGDNHHFGNPFIEWSSSLRSGDLHPDFVLCKDKQFRTNRRAYYSEIKMYHKSMLEDLMKWKERWLSNKDTEKLLSEGFLKKKQGNLAFSSGRDKLSSILKKETANRINICNGDNDRFLSYIKISKAQYKLLKSTKLAGDGIQSTSVTRVLGDIKGIPVHPYDRFEEEERKWLHEHWLQVAIKDLPAAFEVYIARKLQREQWKKAVEQELAQKNVAIVYRDVGTDNTEDSFQEVAYNGDYIHQPADVEDGSDEDSLHSSNDSDVLEGSPGTEKPSSLVNQEVVETLKSSDDFSPSQSMSQNQNDNIMDPHDFVSSAKDMWQTAALGNSYYQSTPYNDEHKSVSDLSFNQPQFIIEHSTQGIGLERDIMASETGRPLTSIFYVDNGSSNFDSFGNQGRTDMLSSFPRGPAMMSSYSHEHMNGVKQSGLPSFIANDSLPESSQSSIQFQPPHQLLEQRQLRDNNPVTHQNFNEEVYPANRYPIQGNFPSLEHNFAALQPAVNAVTEGYSWFPGGSQAYNSWSGVNSSSIGHCLSNIGNTDGTLYSVLNNRLTCPSYSSTRAQHHIQARNSLGGVMSSAHDVYGYAQQLNNPIDHSTAATPSLNSSAWTNIPHQNSSFHDTLGRSFIRPWDS